VATPSATASKKCLGEYCANGSVTGLADVLMESPLFIVVIARNQATKQSYAFVSAAWIASLRSR
jgi:hypothetical protein